MKEQRQVTEEEGKNFAGSLGVRFLESSAKTGENIEVRKKIKEKLENF